MNLITLSEDLKYWRAERPDEWTMDRFIRAAEKLERSTIHNKDYAELIQTRGAQEHRLMDLQDRFDNLSIEYSVLEEDRDAWEQSENSCDEQYNILFAEHEELKKQRYELMYFAEWVLAEADRQRNGEGGDLRTMKHTAEELLIRIKEGEK